VTIWSADSQNMTRVTVDNLSAAAGARPYVLLYVIIVLALCPGECFICCPELQKRKKGIVIGFVDDDMRRGSHIIINKTNHNAFFSLL
jgi:hypothetical protein